MLDTKGLVDKKKLIEKVQSSPCLWDKTDVHHSTAPILLKHWEDIANELNISVSSAKFQWKGLRERFCKMWNARKNNDDECKKQVKWPYYKQLLFLKDHIGSKPRKQNKPRRNHPDFSNAAQCEDGSSDEGHVSPSKSSTIYQRTRLSRKKKSTELEQDHVLNNKFISSCSNVTDNSDADIAFFNRVLPYFKQLSDSDKLEIKLKTMQILKQVDDPVEESTGLANLILGIN